MLHDLFLGVRVPDTPLCHVFLISGVRFRAPVSPDVRESIWTSARRDAKRRRIVRGSTDGRSSGATPATLFMRNAEVVGVGSASNNKMYKKFWYVRER